MRPKNPLPKASSTKEERETKIKTFILAGLDGGQPGGADAIAVLAQSPESPVARAVLALSDELARRGMGAAIILAGGAVAGEDETWSLVFSSGFIHEIRLTANPRILDGHEQLIVGDRAVWFGDCMRRDPSKRDAHESFIANEPAAARAARATFARLWGRAQPIYSNAAIASVTVARAPAGILGHDAPEAIVPAALRTAGAMAAHDPAEAADPVASTLKAWRPATRH